MSSGQFRGEVRGGRSGMFPQPKVHRTLCTEAVRCIVPLCRKVKNVKTIPIARVTCCRSVRRCLNGLDCCTRSVQSNNFFFAGAAYERCGTPPNSTDDHREACLHQCG